MGVPVTEDIVCRAHRPSVDDIFPCLFDGTTIEDYNQANLLNRIIIASQLGSGMKG